jgi:UDP-N-acetylmuramoyl-L-alanyl-D-glutamate--2,6-diaminopimelate ligase
VVNVRLPARVFAAAKKGRLLTFGLGRGEVRGKEIESTPSGTGFVVESRFGKEKAFLPFFGVHNVENALAALAVGLGLGFSLRELLEKLSQASPPPGRFARWETPRGATVVVDFAHNPEALRAMLLALRPRARKLIAVFGCPGEADQGKRRIMGEIAGRLADLVVITSDNPKSEDPKAIAAEIARGAAEVGGTWTVILDRAEAIAWALEEAQAGDCVLIAGKGHERYQIFAHRREPFSDLGLVHALVASSPK